MDGLNLEKRVDIINYCDNDYLIDCYICTKENLLDKPDFFSCIFFCDTNIVLHQLKKLNCLHLCPDTYEERYKEFYCRKIEKVKLVDIVVAKDVFIKPIGNDKLFDGFVAKTQSDISDLSCYKSNTVVYKSEVINIIAEYRLLIGNGKLYGKAHIEGKKIDKYLNKINISRLLSLTKEEFRCIDIGFIDDTKWIIVEINPPYSLDDYDMDFTNYMAFCIDACQFINKKVKEIT